MYGHVLDVTPWTKEQAFEELDVTKACGSPYKFDFGPTKGDVMRHLSFDQLLSDFEKYSQIWDITLKDEIRPYGKDARVFIPANIAMCAVGNWLFGAQNEAVSLQCDHLPIKISISTPGLGMTRLWHTICNTVGNITQYDGAQNDSHTSLAMIALIRDFRKKHLPKEFHSLVDKYYDETYCMKANACGKMIQISGCPSGHTNTAHDNSFVYLCIMMLHAIKNKVTLEEFKSMVLCIYGDDMILNDNGVSCFTPTRIQECVCNNLQMYLESPSDSDTFDNLTFIGTHPVFRNFRGQKYLLYSYDTIKMLNTFNFYRKVTVPSETVESLRLQKMISICQNIFAEEAQFKRMKREIKKYASCAKLSVEQGSKLSLLSSLYIFSMYTGFETNPVIF